MKQGWLKTQFSNSLNWNLGHKILKAKEKIKSSSQEWREGASVGVLSFFPFPESLHQMATADLSLPSRCSYDEQLFFFFVICSRKSLPLEIYKVFSIFIIDMCPPLLPKCN